MADKLILYDKEANIDKKYLNRNVLGNTIVYWIRIRHKIRLGEITRFDIKEMEIRIGEKTKLE